MKSIIKLDIVSFRVEFFEENFRIYFKYVYFRVILVWGEGWCYVRELKYLLIFIIFQVCGSWQSLMTG